MNVHLALSLSGPQFAAWIVILCILLTAYVVISRDQKKKTDSERKQQSGASDSDTES